MKSNRNHLKKGLAAAAGTAAAALFIFLAVKLVAMEKSLNTLLPQLYYLQDSVSVLQSDLGTMEANIETALEEESSLIEEYSIRANNCDFANKTYDVEIAILPKEYTESTQVTVFFGTKGCSLELSGISFKGNATLSMDNTYDGNVTVLFTNGEKRSTEVLSSYKGFLTMLTGALGASLTDISAAPKNGEWTVGGTVSYDLDGKNSMEFTSFRLTAKVGDETVYDYDLIRESGGAIGTETFDADGDDVNALTGDAAQSDGADQTAGSSDAKTADDAAEDAGGTDGISGTGNEDAFDGVSPGGDSADDAAGLAGAEGEASGDIGLSDDAEQTGAEGDADDEGNDSEGTAEDDGKTGSGDTSGDADETILATSGELPIEFSYEASVDDADMTIYLTAVTTEGITIRLTLFDGALSGTANARAEAMASYVPTLDFYDKNNVQYNAQ